MLGVMSQTHTPTGMNSQAHFNFNAIFILDSMLKAVDMMLFQLQDVIFQVVFVTVLTS